METLKTAPPRTRGLRGGTCSRGECSAGGGFVLGKVGGMNAHTKPTNHQEVSLRKGWGRPGVSSWLGGIGSAGAGEAGNGGVKRVGRAGEEDLVGGVDQIGQRQGAGDGEAVACRQLFIARGFRNT